MIGGSHLGRISVGYAVEQVFCSSPATNLVGVEANMAYT